MKRNFFKAISLYVVLTIVASFVCLQASALEYGAEWSGYQASSGQKYKDVPPDYWAYNAINQVSSKNWFNGYPDGSFLPEASITRAEALKVFVEFLGLELQDVTESSFYDVDPNEWYAPYIEAGKDLFPTHTSIQGKRPFQPDMPVTREDTIYALVNALGCMNDAKYVDQSVLNMFKDQGSISGDLKAHFAVALTEGLVSGYPDDTIRAQDPLARAEFATLLLRGTEHGFHDNYQAKIQSVTVFPPSPVEITIGESITLTARATYTDGKSLEYTAIAPYDSSNNGVISLSGNTITGVKEGAATVKYNSEYLKSSSLVVNVKKPTDGPQIKVTNYPNETGESSVTVEGIVTDENIATVDFTCNERDVLLNGDGSFSTLVSLKAGENTVKFVATNQYGISTEKSITIVRTSAPVIFITNYKEKTTATKTTVTGIVSDSELKSVKLDCDGKPLAFAADGSFTTEVELKTIGKNPFTFAAVNQYGQRAEQTIVITRYDFDEEEPDDSEVPDDPFKTKGKVELAFVIDSTGSMGDEIGNVKTNVTEFARHLETLGVDLKMTVVEYKDITFDGKESTQVHMSGGSPWHTSSDALVSTLTKIEAFGGGDDDETPLDAFGRVLDNKYMDWSGDAYKFTVLLTDAGCKSDNTYGLSGLDDVANKLADKHINVSVITAGYMEDTYRVLYEKTGGIQADILSDFDTILSNLADRIVEVSL